MAQTLQIISMSFRQALQELRVNRLRSALSLTGITIGIFCIIAVLTVLDSLEDSIRKRVESLGSDVLYIDRMPPWGGGAEEEGLTWQDYLQRPVMSIAELNAITRNVQGIGSICLVYPPQEIKAKRIDQELSGIRAYAVTQDFEKIQNIDVKEGRYLTSSELDGGAQVAVIGNDVYESLFPGNISPIGKSIQVFGRNFRVVGLLKKSGQNVAGFDFDNCIIYSYQTALAFQNPKSKENFNDPLIMVKAGTGMNLEYLKDEVTGALRVARHLRPGQKSDFSINQLTQVLKSLDTFFGVVKAVGGVIGGFSLIVGAFGIANIMFVTVKERTKIIGLKKAIGARRSVILTEFLIEAIVLCLLGGGIGLVVVFLLGLLMTYGLDFDVALSMGNIGIGLTVSVIVGLFSGMIPALRASRLDPVVAIRTT